MTKQDSGSSSAERCRKAARDGYLQILSNATRKECNAPDEDGMTATHWAAYAGNLNALRIIVGRGGDPEKCDNYGNTALHWCANNGHLKCVSFLVSFGANLWAMDNQFHTAKELAAINDRESVIQLLDEVVAQQSALHTKMVQKLKVKSLAEAEKRVKNFRKLQNKTIKQAEKQEEKLRHKIQENIYDTLESSTSSYGGGNGIARYSELVNSTSKSSAGKMKILSGVSRRVFRHQADTIKSDEGTNTYRSMQSMMVGIRRDDQIVYVPKFSSLSIGDLAQRSPTATAADDQRNESRPRLREVFSHPASEQQIQKSTTTAAAAATKGGIKTTLKSKLFKLNKLNGSGSSGGGNRKSGNLYRAISEPDFSQAIVADDDTTSGSHAECHQYAASIFERPGFGSVTFRGKFTPELLFSSAGTSQYYRDDSGGEDNSEIEEEEEGDNDFDSGHSGHENSQTSSSSDADHHRHRHYMPLPSINKTPVGGGSADADSFASDSIGSAGSLTQQPSESCLDALPEVTRRHRESKSISVLLFLYAHGLKDYYEVFESEQIDIEALMLLNEQDLVSLGVPLGPRRKLLNAIEQRRRVLGHHGADVGADENDEHDDRRHHRFDCFETRL